MESREQGELDELGGVEGLRLGVRRVRFNVQVILQTKKGFGEHETSNVNYET